MAAAPEIDLCDTLPGTLAALGRSVGAAVVVVQRLVRVPAEDAVLAVDSECWSPGGPRPCLEGMRVDDVAGDVSTLVPVGAFALLEEGALAVRVRQMAGPRWAGAAVAGAALEVADAGVRLVWLLRPAAARAFGRHEVLRAGRWLGELASAFARRSVVAPWRAAPGTFVVMPSVGVLWRTAAVDAAFERELVRVAAEHLAGDRGERAQLGDLHLRLTSMAGPQGPAVLVRAGGTEDVGVSPVLGLSATRRRIVSFAVQGATVGEIARALDRSPETVRTHLKHIYAHVGVGSRVELAEASRTPWL